MSTAIILGGTGQIGLAVAERLAHDVDDQALAIEGAEDLAI
ncbi:hypothetical protein [Sinorhizobium sp. BJ1]|jgi:NAD(P)-dependent dehydrogenase (short-subunit alcohol dehydrogenase family)|nr:hypothetical protein [Sinorhizobium sp. BJ1]